MLHSASSISPVRTRSDLAGPGWPWPPLRGEEAGMNTIPPSFSLHLMLLTLMPTVTPGDQIAAVVLEHRLSLSVFPIC